MTQDDLGVNLHTAARKCMDSTQSVAVWNLINVLPKKVWKAYLDTLWEFLKNKPENPAEVVREVSCDWVERMEGVIFGDTEDYITYYKKRDAFKKINGYSYAYTLEAIFKLFTDDDWEGYCYWLDEKENG